MTKLEELKSDSAGVKASRDANVWRIWAKSLGEKVGDTDTQADWIAVVRTFWWIVHIVTCFMIIIHNGAKLGWWL